MAVSTKAEHRLDHAGIETCSRKDIWAGKISSMSHFGPPVAAATSNDPLFRMRAYQIAKDLLQTAWLDAKTLSADPITQKMSGQLYAAIGSISANIGEGYSRSSGIDRARIFEYALGSVRESMTWYEAARPTLGDVVLTRLDDLEEIRRLLLAIIPRERARRGRLSKE